MRALVWLLIVVLAGCLSSGQGPVDPTVSSSSSPDPVGPAPDGSTGTHGPQTVPSPAPPPDDAPPEAVILEVPVRPEGASRAFVWRLPEGAAAPALHRPDGARVHFEAAMLAAPPGLTDWALHVFDLGEAARPAMAVVSPALQTTGEVAGLEASSRPFYFHLPPDVDQVGLWLSAKGGSGRLDLALRLLDHDPGHMYVSTSGLAEPPAADDDAFLGRLGTATPVPLAPTLSAQGWSLELHLASDVRSEAVTWTTPGVVVETTEAGNVEQRTLSAEAAARAGWASAIAGDVRLTGVQRWNAEAEVMGHGGEHEVLGPVTTEEWPFGHWGFAGEGVATLHVAHEGATLPELRRGAFLLWSTAGSTQDAFGVPFAPSDKKGIAGYQQGLGPDGAMRVELPEGPGLTVPDVGRAVGIEVPVADEQTEARAADRPSEDLRPVQTTVEMALLRINRDMFVAGGSAGASNDNCVTLDLSDTRLLWVNASAAWTPGAGNPDDLAVVAQSLPYHGFDAAYGPSPLALAYGGGELPRAEGLRIGVQSMDTSSRQDVPVALAVDQEVELTLEMTYQGSPPTVPDERSSCGVVWS